MRLREAGPRSIEDIPANEIAAMMTDAASSVGWQDTERLFRTVLDRLELVRLTKNAREILEAIRDIAADQGAESPRSS